MAPKKALPLPDWVPPWWVGLALIAGWPVIGLMAWGVADDAQEVLDHVGPLMGLPASGLAILLLSAHQRWRLSRYEREARRLGLAFRARVSESDLDRGLSLFALTRERRHWGGYLMAGKFHGQPVTVFDYGFSGKFRTTDERTVVWAGRQTVFLLPAGAAGLLLLAGGQ
jgi:hypothetical protein